MMWLWLGFPQALAAALAAIALVWVMETKNSLAWLASLAALFRYSESMKAWRLMVHGWKTPPRTSDHIGIVAQAIHLYVGVPRCWRLVVKALHGPGICCRVTIGLPF